jgi:hypothetical protein
MDEPPSLLISEPTDDCELWRRGRTGRRFEADEETTNFLGVDPDFFLSDLAGDAAAS